MNTNHLPYEQELAALDYVISGFTKRREELIEKHTLANRSTEATEAYEMTADPLVARFLILRGHKIPAYRDGFDRGAVTEAILAECSDATERAYGYMDLSREGSGPWVKFHAFCEDYYAWRDGDLDKGAA